MALRPRAWACAWSLEPVLRDWGLGLSKRGSTMGPVTGPCGLERGAMDPEPWGLGRGPWGLGPPGAWGVGPAAWD